MLFICVDGVSVPLKYHESQVCIPDVTHTLLTDGNGKETRSGILADIHDTHVVVWCR